MAGMCWKILIHARLPWNYPPGPYCLFKKANIAYAPLWTDFSIWFILPWVSQKGELRVSRNSPQRCATTSKSGTSASWVRAWCLILYGTAHMGLFGRFSCWCVCHASSPSLATFQTKRLQKQMFFPATPTVWFNLAFINSGVCFGNNVKTLGSGGSLYRHHIVTFFCSSGSK